MASVLERLQTAKGHLAVPVDDTIRSLGSELVKTFESPAGSRYSHITIRIRTRHVAWSHEEDTSVRMRSARGTVGWYAWRWQTHGVTKTGLRHLTVTANNTLMLDPDYMARNEKTRLGRLSNEVLLYHELLHGQLLINAMDEPAWRERLCRTGRLDVESRDAEHAVIRGLEREFLSRRAADISFVVQPGSDDRGSFQLVAASLPKDFHGGVSASFQIVGDGNVRNLRLELPRRGENAGSVVIRGELVDPTRRGFFLAVVEPNPRA